MRKEWKIKNDKAISRSTRRVAVLLLSVIVAGSTMSMFRPVTVWSVEGETVKYGDVNGDDNIDIADALLISRYDARLTELDENQLKIADVNNDKEADIADALLIARLDAGLIEEILRLDDMVLKEEWKQDQVFNLADPAPWNLDELQQVVDVNDPRSVAAYWVWAVNRLTDNYDEGMAMMKYLFADIEVYGSGYTEGGMSGMAGWDAYFNERLTDPEYRILPRTYFQGCTEDNGYKPDRPLSIELYFNDANTETINKQTFDTFGRLNIVYWVQSYAGDNQVNINLSRFAGTNRWYVTSGTSSMALFYQQQVTDLAKELPNDDSTQEEHDAFYGS